MKYTHHTAIALAVGACILSGCSGGGSGGSAGGSAASLASLQTAAGTTTKTGTRAPAVQPPADACSVAYWGDSVSALTGPKLDKRLHVAMHAVVGGTAQAALPQVLQDTMAERFVVIEYGTNDANYKADLATPMRSMLDYAKSKQRKPVLTAMSNATAGELAYHSTLNLVIASLAGEYKSLFANWPTVQYAGAGDLMPDGVHPNDGYQQRLADRLSQTILDAAPECQ